MIGKPFSIFLGFEAVNRRASFAKMVNTSSVKAKIISQYLSTPLHPNCTRVAPTNSSPIAIPICDAVSWNPKTIPLLPGVNRSIIRENA